MANLGSKGNFGTNEIIQWSNGNVSISFGEKDPLFDIGAAENGTATPRKFLDHLQTNLTHFYFEGERYGYGSGKVGPTMRFPLAAVYIYMIVMGTYFLYVTVVSKFWWKSSVSTVVAWDDIAELLLLAWNSTSRLSVSRSSVEVDKSRWRVEVGIRTEANGRAELVAENEGVKILRRGGLYH